MNIYELYFDKISERFYYVILIVFLISLYKPAFASLLAPLICIYAGYFISLKLLNNKLLIPTFTFQLGQLLWILVGNIYLISIHTFKLDSVFVIYMTTIILQIAFLDWLSLNIRVKGAIIGLMLLNIFHLADQGIYLSTQLNTTLVLPLVMHVLFRLGALVTLVFYYISFKKQGSEASPSSDDINYIETHSRSSAILRILSKLKVSKKAIIILLLIAIFGVYLCGKTIFNYGKLRALQTIPNDKKINIAVTLESVDWDYTSHVGSDWTYEASVNGNKLLEGNPINMIVSLDDTLHFDETAVENDSIPDVGVGGPLVLIDHLDLISNNPVISNVTVTENRGRYSGYRAKNVFNYSIRREVSNSDILNAIKGFTSADVYNAFKGTKK